MRTIKGPGLFLAQFMRDVEPYSSLKSISKWAADCGYEGVQIPSNDPRCMDLSLAAESDAYCDDLRGIVSDSGLVITDLSAHIYGQLMAVHPAYSDLFSGFYPDSLRDASDRTRYEWATNQLKLVARACRRLGLTECAAFSGSFLWHTMYPWPQRPQGLVEDGFRELARRWRPVLEAFDEAGTDLCFELHPCEDLHDGISFERFLDAVDQHPRANILFDPSHLHLQHIDYLAFMRIYRDRIKMFHVKDAELRYDGRSGVYGGYQDWIDRSGRFRSLGDGQIDFKAIFSNLAQDNFGGWAVVEWECALKSSEVGARQGAEFVKSHIIEAASYRFDDFAGVVSDPLRNARILGLRST